MTHGYRMVTVHRSDAYELGEGATGIGMSVRVILKRHIPAVSRPIET